MADCGPRRRRLADGAGCSRSDRVRSRRPVCGGVGPESRNSVGWLRRSYRGYLLAERRPPTPIRWRVADIMAHASGAKKRSVSRSIYGVMVVRAALCVPVVVLSTGLVWIFGAAAFLCALAGVFGVWGDMALCLFIPCALVFGLAYVVRVVAIRQVAAVETVEPVAAQPAEDLPLAETLVRASSQSVIPGAATLLRGCSGERDCEANELPRAADGHDEER